MFKMLHDENAIQMFLGDIIVLACAVVDDLYGKHAKAQRVLCWLLVCDAVSWNVKIVEYANLSKHRILLKGCEPEVQNIHLHLRSVFRHEQLKGG